MLQYIHMNGPKSWWVGLRWGCTWSTKSPQKKHIFSQNYPPSTQSPHYRSSIVGVSIIDTQSEHAFCGGTVAISVKQTAQTPRSISAPHANVRSLFDFYTTFMLCARVHIEQPRSSADAVSISRHFRLMNFSFRARQPRPARVGWKHHQSGAHHARPVPEGEHHERQRLRPRFAHLRQRRDYHLRYARV